MSNIPDNDNSRSLRDRVERLKRQHAKFELTQDGNHFLWNEQVNAEFVTWWKDTSYFIQSQIDPRIKIKDINWQANSKKQGSWVGFTQCCRISDGRPLICCLTCHKLLEHPIPKQGGNNPMKTHKKSKFHLIYAPTPQVREVEELVRISAGLVRVRKLHINFQEHH